jgi:vancomycin resistance protein VanJ
MPYVKRRVRVSREEFYGEEPPEDRGDEVPAEPSPPSPWPLRLSVAYLILVCLAGFSGRLLAERLWWSTFLIYIPQIVWLPLAVIGLLVATALRNVKAMAANAATSLVVLGPMMGFTVPSPRLGSANAPKARFLSYNIKGGLEGFVGLSSQIDRFKPDVVVFSEALGWADDTKTRAWLRERFPNWSSLYAGDVYIASRWPFAERDSRPVGPQALRYQGESRRAGHALVDAPFGRFHVLGTHFYTAMHATTLWKERRNIPAYVKGTAEARGIQADQLLGWAEELQGPVVLAGDFNTPPVGRIYGRITRGYRDAFGTAGWGWGQTYPSKTPLLRIDYIFHTPDWSTVSCEVGWPVGSDHRPVFAELALTK